MNKDMIFINNMKEIYNDNCVGADRRVAWEYLPQVSKPCPIILNYPTIQISWRGSR